MGPGGPRGLQILLPGARTIRGGFDSHTFPPRLRARRFVAGLLVLIAIAALPAAARAAETPANRVSPFGASIRSLVFPGWGQLHNGSQIKSVVIFSFQSYLLGRVFVIERRARWYDDQRNDPNSPWTAEDLEARYRNLHDRRGDMVWWSAIVALYSVIDAYVDAHMVGFDEDVKAVERVTWSVAPGPGANGGVVLGLAARF